jgi:hypothetical protein
MNLAAVLQLTSLVINKGSLRSSLFLHLREKEEEKERDTEREYPVFICKIYIYFLGLYGLYLL